MNINASFPSTRQKNCGEATPFYNYYMKEPEYDPNCRVNDEWDTLPPNWPRETTNFGPASLKHIYPTIPDVRDRKCGLYPPQRISRPVNTMYSEKMTDNRYDPQLVCSWGKRGFQAYPFQTWSPKEHREFVRNLQGEMYILPQQDIHRYTRYHTQHW